MTDTITKLQYADAVDRFVSLAKQPTHGGRVAAQVLLSAYNGEAFQLDVSALTSLDGKNFEDAILVIKGRYKIGEPHWLLRNGSDVFGKLWSQWGHLKLSERAKVRCTSCGGHGRVWPAEYPDDDDPGEECRKCRGAGRVYPTR